MNGVDFRLRTVSRLDIRAVLHIAPTPRAPEVGEQATVYAAHVVRAVQDLAAALTRPVTEDCAAAAWTLPREFNVGDLVGVPEDHVEVLTGTLPVSFFSARMAA